MSDVRPTPIDWRAFRPSGVLYPEPAEVLDPTSLQAENTILKAEVTRLTNARIADQLAIGILLEILGQDHIKGHLTPTDLRHMAAVKGD